MLADMYAIHSSLIACLLASPPVLVAEPPAAEAPPEGFEPGWGPALLAVLPGLLVHGTGHWVAGDSETAGELLAIEGVGVGALLLSGTVLYLTGASRRVVGPAASTAIAGMGLFVNSAASDIYGAATGGRAAGPRPYEPVVEARFGYRYVYDPQFEYGSFLVPGVQARWWRLFGDTEAWAAVDDETWRIRQRVWWRALGAVGRRDDASALDLEVAVTWADYESSGFQVLTTDLFIGGRYDLKRLSPTLRGSFAHGGLGWGVEVYGYDVPGLHFGEDVAELLLGRFGWGMYFGDGDGELLLYYDHRHDDFAAGLGVEGISGGVLGHFGLQLVYDVVAPWSVQVDFEVGSAWIAGLSARYRYGGDE